MKKILSLMLLSIVSVSSLLAADQIITFVGSGESHDEAERRARDQGNNLGKFFSLESVDTKMTGPKMWICVMRVKIKN